MNPFGLRAAVTALDSAARRRLFERSTSRDPAVRDTVARIIARVRDAGDDALHALAVTHDGVRLEALEVDPAVVAAAPARIDPAVRGALERVAAALRAVHRTFVPQAGEIESRPGVIVGRRPDPLGRVGIYAPGGTATYPSSVLMGAVPARVAGVREILLCSPPASSGAPSDVLLAAAAIAGVTRVFALGGAGAIAAMAYGTASVPRVDRIVGPGNAWVAEAKLQVTGAVSIDAPAGPSELLAVADADADPAAVAADLIAQAEHDPRAAAVAVAVDADPVRAGALADRIAACVAREAAATPRAGIVNAALAANGALLTAADRNAALAFAAAYAPEHLLLAVRDPDAWLPAVRNAGTVYLGTGGSSVCGDYATGANHTLPTGGLARAYSGLSTLDFVRWTTWQRITPRGAAAMADDIERLALAEGLPAHAHAVRPRVGAP